MQGRPAVLVMAGGGAVVWVVLSEQRDREMALEGERDRVSEGEDGGNEGGGRFK